MKTLAAEELGFPRFELGGAKEGDVFALSSHKRARDALELGMRIEGNGSNIFVIGEDRSGRLTSTISIVERFAATAKTPDDWVYLQCFRKPSRSRAYRLPPGMGHEFQQRMALLVRQLRKVLGETLTEREHRPLVNADEARALGVIEDELNAVRSMARLEGFDIRQTAQGATLTPATEPGTPATGNVPDPLSPGFIHALPNLANRLNVIVRQSIALWVAVGQRMDQSERTLAEGVTSPLLDEIVDEFGKFDGLVDWLALLREDIADNISAFLGRTDGAAVPAIVSERRPEQRYAVNLLIDNRDQLGGPVVLEPNPTYENMFGWIEYRLGEQPYNTDFTMIRAGALHRANGGVLVLRAEAVDPNVWKHLKAALRDSEIRIEEPHRAGTVPLAGTPKPHAIPLTVKVVLVAPRFWYNAASSSDADFKSYFKIKADIDPDMDATPDNLGVYAGLIRAMATKTECHGIEDDAIHYLLGLSSKWAADRSKLSSQFERIEDVIMEAFCLREGAGHLSLDLVTRAVGNCRQRNCRIEDRLQEAIAQGKVLISTQGAVIGQVNALAVHGSVDHIFGLPVRITARTGVGRRGILNIEHDASLGGPIHQKSILVLQGFLWGRFGSRFPPSFNCSITFEQSYETIEGDSASLAAVLAILSGLSGVPLRQDLAVTGSINQRGEAQAVGGVHHKIEGFFRTCLASGLTGTQGVVVPAANERNLVLRQEVCEAVSQGQFHVYSVQSVDEAIDLLASSASPNTLGAETGTKVYDLVMAQLEAFNEALMERSSPSRWPDSD